MIPASSVGDPHLTDGELRVLIALQLFALNTGTCNPSTQKIATTCGKPVGTIRRLFRSLVRKGYISVESAPSTGHRLAISLPSEWENRRPDSEPPAQPTPSIPDSPLSNYGPTGSPEVDTPPVQNWTHGVSSSGPTGGPELDTFLREEEKKEENTHTEATAPVEVDSHGEPINLDCGVVNDEAEVRRLIREVDEDIFPGLWFGNQVRAYSKTYPIAWIRRAIEDARSWRTPPRSFRPILNDLREYARAGGPPPDPEPSVRSEGSGKRREDHAPPIFRATPEQVARLAQRKYVRLPALRREAGI